MDGNADFLVMAKPAGPRCNLRCSYCYYVGKEALFGAALHGAAPGPMTAEILERYLAQRIDVAAGGSVHFEWHGGEPTLLGLDTFKRIAQLQRKYRPGGRGITNGLQTNGLLLNAAWASFFAREKWSVGLSLDGPADIHDKYRRTVDSRPTHARVLSAFNTLRQRGVFVNVLCVLNEANTARPEEIYAFFRGLGVRYLQFLPLVTPASGSQAHPAAATPEAIGEFLCRVFDLWTASDVGRIVIQTFDEALRPIYGVPHALCIHSETCGQVPVLERDGSVYACDHFVDPEHLIGNLVERDLASLIHTPRQIAFGAAKKETLPQVCRACAVLASCNGGCPKDRIVPAAEGGFPINYLCPAYKRFFAHVKPTLERLAAHMKTGRALREFRTTSV
jgi:uncharacterized protein